MNTTISQTAPSGSSLSAGQVADVLLHACPVKDCTGKKVLLIVPDGTRTAPVCRLSAPEQAVGALCVRAIRSFTIRASLPESLAPLRDLVLNLRWSWHSETRELFAGLDPAGRSWHGSKKSSMHGFVCMLVVCWYNVQVYI